MADSVKHFRKFVNRMDAMLRSNEKEDDRTQREMMERLFVVEDNFKKTLIRTGKGRKIYAKFMNYFLHERSSILGVRSYFREKQSIFSSQIAAAFRKKDPTMLHRFRVNYVFIRWAMEEWNKASAPRKDLVRMFDEIVRLRKAICENSLPSAIHQAKIFWSRVPYTKLEYMDLIQNASEGLLTAVDKFVPPFKKVFGSVAVSRMKLNIMTDHSSTLLKIPTREKRILYRVNLAKNREKMTAEKDIVKYVKQSFKSATAESVNRISQAVVVSSLDAAIGDESDAVLADIVPATAIENPEEATSGSQSISFCVELLRTLTPLERKVIFLKYGIKIYDLYNQNK